MNLLSSGIAAVEHGMVPDWLTRRAIRRLCRQRLREMAVASLQHSAVHADFLASLHHESIPPVRRKPMSSTTNSPPSFSICCLVRA